MSSKKSSLVTPVNFPMKNKLTKLPCLSPETERRHTQIYFQNRNAFFADQLFEAE
jgi:hypothetical protein